MAYRRDLERLEVTKPSQLNTAFGKHGATIKINWGKHEVDRPYSARLVPKSQQRTLRISLDMDKRQKGIGQCSTRYHIPKGDTLLSGATAEEMIPCPRDPPVSEQTGGRTHGR
jgi:hypothetical protein